MSITAVVENDSIKLPPGMHVPDGTQVEITLPEPSDPANAAEQQAERAAWLAQSERRLHEV